MNNPDYTEPQTTLREYTVVDFIPSSTTAHYAVFPRFTSLTNVSKYKVGTNDIARVDNWSGGVFNRHCCLALKASMLVCEPDPKQLPPQ